MVKFSWPCNGDGLVSTTLQCQLFLDIPCDCAFSTIRINGFPILRTDGVGWFMELKSLKNTHFATDLNLRQIACELNKEDMDGWASVDSTLINSVFVYFVYLWRMTKYIWRMYLCILCIYVFDDKEEEGWNGWRRWPG